MDTLFIIELKVNDESIILGPYLSLQDAATILVDCAPVIARCASTKNKYKYSAELRECLLTDQKIWETIAIPIKENECFRKKSP